LNSLKEPKENRGKIAERNEEGELGKYAGYYIKK
jgi:hypothetical protein